MIKILQFGEGNFLRTFADLYFDTLNKEKLGDYKVTIVQPIPFGNLDNFVKQNNKYNVVLRGVSGGKAEEKIYHVDSVVDVFSPFAQEDKFYKMATDPELKIIVSNTTEAGICYNEDDDINGFENITYPGKLTKFLYARYKSGLDGVYLMPVELIDNNADELKKCVDKYINLWNLEEEFKIWNDTKNFYCNTLVDRIVSGYPREEGLRNHLTDLIGYTDNLVSIGEPFGLWAVEKKGNIGDYIIEGKHNIDVVLTENIGYYKKRKVRVLNGSHTNLVAVGLMLGKTTVFDCMTDEKILSFIEKTLTENIIPYVSSDIAATTSFAESVKERFFNPYLNHQLLSISLNSISKWRARDLPSFKDYYNQYGKIPSCLTKGFSYLMALYASIFEENGKYFVNLPSGKVEFKDTIEYLEFFAKGGQIKDFMSREDIWGEDLTTYIDFVDVVTENVNAIKSGKNIL